MPKFSVQSLTNLESCHIILVKTFMIVIEDHDCTILEGHRSEERQRELIRQGLSRTTVEEAKHCRTPSEAIDAIRFPIDWNDIEGHHFFAGVVKTVAKQKFGATIRWGGDWDGDNDFKDQNFMDLVHFEVLDV